jgi:hypothetical protein
MLFGRAKGSIAEIMAQEHLGQAYRPRELPITLLDQFKISVPKHIKQFLRENWYSIDLFSFELKDYVVQNLIILEVKARNHNPNPANIWTPKLTSNCYNIYKTAQRQGYVVKYVEVIFYYNWEYEVKCSDLNLSAFTIDDGHVQFRKRIPSESN